MSTEIKQTKGSGDIRLDQVEDLGGITVLREVAMSVDGTALNISKDYQIKMLVLKISP